MKLLIAKGRKVLGARVGVFGLTFKENVPDLRNTRVMDLCAELREYGLSILVHDPLADPDEILRETGLLPTSLPDMRDLDAAVLAVAHEHYKTFRPAEFISRFARPDTALVLDVKGLWQRQEAEQAGFLYWRL